MFRVVLLWSSLVVAFPAAAVTDHLAADRTTLLQWVEGSFSNERQVREGTNALAEIALDPNKAPDLLFPVFKKIEVPALVGDVIYLQWPMGSPDGKLQRQRIWVFTPDPARNANMMKFYTLKEPEKWLNAHLEPNKVRSMTLTDLIPYPPACDLPYRRHGDVFIGEIPRGECKIVSQQTKTSMTIYGRTIISKDKLWYDEAGIRDDGAVVFDVPRSGAYEFDRR